MDKYCLYLDESKTHCNSKNCVFCIAGIIIHESYIENLENRLTDFKNTI